MIQLSNTLLNDIFSWLPFKDLANLSPCSQRFNQVVKDFVRTPYPRKFSRVDPKDAKISKISAVLQTSLKALGSNTIEPDTVTKQHAITKDLFGPSFHLYVSKPYCIAILTCRGKDQYKGNEKVIERLFQEYGAQAHHVIWNESLPDWKNYNAVLIRSTWDYFLHLDPFLNTLREIEKAGTLLLNPLKTIEWNCKKTYLKDLPKNFRIDTIWLTKSQLPQIKYHMQEKDWAECILKPTVSAGGHHTYRFTLETFDPIIETCVKTDIEDWMLQPFMKEIIDQGEWSLVFLEGKCLRGILKKPALGKFLVQGFHGGSFTIKKPPQWLVDQAKKILSESGQDFLYARVDLVALAGESCKVMEIEAIEPDLFLENCRGPINAFAISVIGRIQSKEIDQIVERVRARSNEASLTTSRITQGTGNAF